MTPSSTRYPVPAERLRVEEEIQRSRFITTLTPVFSERQARAFIEEIRSEFPDATHNCWAYLIGPPGSSALVGMSDDGEPHGTAGRPMLNMLSHGPCGDIAAVVTRYYGGAKLGKGGLVRAYGGGVQLGLASLKLKEKLVYRRARLALPYSFVSHFQQIAARYQVAVLEENYGAEVGFLLNIPDDRVESLEADLTAAGSGQWMLEWEELG